MRLRFLLLASLALASCVKYEPATQAVVSPGDDPLVNLIYQNLLSSNGIEYTLNPDGYYISELGNRGAMDDLALRAHDQLREVSQIQLDNSCVTDHLNERLQGVVYLVGENERGIFLRAATTTFERHEILSKVTAAKRECVKGA